MIQLSPIDLSLAAILIILLAVTSFRMKLDLEKTLIISAIRTFVQLTLIGLILKSVFNHAHILWVSLIALVMLILAGREVLARQPRGVNKVWGYSAGTFSMFISSFTLACFALIFILRAEPWYAPRYAIPLLGMLLGNTMTGVAITLNHFILQVEQRKNVIEQKLTLGHDSKEAIAEIRKESMRTGMIPIINSMAAAGIVSLPGMMTGQILAGAPVMQAIQYQVLIMFLITAGTGMGVVAIITIVSRKIFDDRQRLTLSRVYKAE